MTMHRIRGVVTLLGVSALVLAGPTAAAVADSDLQTLDGSQDQQAEQDREWSLDRSEESEQPEDSQADRESRLGSLTEQQDGSSREAANADDATAEDAAASSPAEDFCDATFGDDEDAHAQCMAFAESFPSEEEGGDEEGAEEQDPFQQFCDEAFGDNEDAHAQCTEFAGNFAGEEEEPSDEPTEEEGGEDDTTGEDGAEENPFQQFCDEAFGDNEDAHAQCSELAQVLGGEEEPSDEPTEEEPEQDDEETGTLPEDQTASPAADDGALPVTGLNLAVAGLSSLSLLGLGGALLRRFRADSLG